MSHISTSLNINNPIRHTSNKIAIITVVYQNYEVLTDFFSSFKNQTNQGFHFFISDLSDNKKLINPQTINKQQLTILTNINKGYAYGINLGIQQAIKLGYNKFCIINSDTIVDNNFVSSTLLSINHYPSSIIGGKIYYAPGYEYHKSRYTKNELGKIIWYAGGLINWNHLHIKHRGVDEIDNNQFSKLESTDFITGCLMIFDKSIIDNIGYWNEDYFLYYEDADYCERAKKQGINLYYDPSIIIWHKNAQSTGGSGSKIHQNYQEKNKIKFSLKYAPLKTKLHLIINYLKKIFSI